MKYTAVPALVLALLSSCATDSPDLLTWSEYSAENPTIHPEDPTGEIPPGSMDVSDIRITSVEYADNLVADIYYPPGQPDGESLPFVVLVNPWTDSQDDWRYMGFSRNETKLHRSWALRLASEGIVAVAYQAFDVESDTRILLDYLQDNRKSLKLDTGRTGMLSTDEGAEFAYQLLDDADLAAVSGLRAVVFYYPWKPRRGGLPASEDAAFLYAEVSRVPQKQHRIWVDSAAEFYREAGYPVERLEHPDAASGFEYLQHDAATAAIVDRTIGFFSERLE